MTAHAWWVALAMALPACGDSEPIEPPLGPVVDPLEWVDPTIGTGGFGFAYGSAFVGAAAPHGLVKLGPDTSGPFGTIAFQHYSGYYADDDVVESFSHLHLHGAGLADYGVLGVMPTTAFDAATPRASDYRATFDKASESARPGRYAVTLSPAAGPIDVELTATTRAAHHRYTFAPGAAGTLVVDLTRALAGGEVTSFAAAVDPATPGQLSGTLSHAGQMSGNYGGFDVHFVLRARTPWQSHDETSVGFALHFAADEPVEIVVGVSFVSLAGAQANLDAELPAFDFDGTSGQTAAAWRDRLSSVIVEGGTVKTRRMFYSALYRSFLMPTIASDVDGSYVYGGVSGTSADGAFMTDLSLWDTYRTLHPLYHLIAPDSGADSARSLVMMSAVGEGFPRWPIATGESGTMLGASADVVLADAAIKLGALPGFDPAAVFAQLTTIATDPTLTAAERGGRHPADRYIELGYVPSSEGRSVSTQLEFSVDDFALARMADSVGDTAAAQIFDARALGYRELFDPATMTFRPKDEAGVFQPAQDYDRYAFGDEFAEANAEQMQWAPLFDVAGLAALLGGDDAMIERLDGWFELARVDLEARGLTDLAANTAPRPYYWHGNEPDIHAAYLFGQLGRDDLSQRWLAWIRDNLYADAPYGLAGNDDSGTLSSWYVWTALGIYPVAGSDRYFVGAPLFPRVTVTTATGTLVIETTGDIGSRGAVGVSGVSVDGETQSRALLAHDQLVGDRTISFEVAGAPTAWSTP